MSSAACYPDKSPKVSQLLHTLEDEIRREILNYFENASDSPSAALNELVRHIAARVPYVAEAELRSCLWHQHLPLLRERGWIEFDYRNDRVRYHGHDDARRFLLDIADVFE
jgi:DNA-binding transcriptional ArsR family regulator